MNIMIFFLHLLFINWLYAICSDVDKIFNIYGKFFCLNLNIYDERKKHDIIQFYLYFCV